MRFDVRAADYFGPAVDRTRWAKARKGPSQTQCFGSVAHQAI
jgi:hypothetical protein